MADEKKVEPPRSNIVVEDHGNLISIYWERARIHHSKFPDPLITVDYALDDRAIGIVLAGSKADELRSALRES
jgi:hypothetical protein